MRRVTGPYSGGSSRLWPIVSFLLGMALIATVVAIAFAIGILRLPDDEVGGVSSPRPTTVAGATAAPSPTHATPTAEPTGQATAPPSPSPPPQATPGGIHVVAPGESLFSIGVLYGVPWQLIAEANGIENPDYIELGQELVIPVPAPPSGAATVHVVQAGESIYSIAEKYEITPTELADANDIEDWDLIYVGQTLVIPGPGAEATEEP